MSILKTTLAAAAATMLAGCCANTNAPAKPYSQLMVEAHGLGDFNCNTKYKDTLATTGWDYVSGLVANAVLKTWEKYPERTEYLEAVKAFADYSTAADGQAIYKAPKKVSALGPSNIDDLAAGKIFFTLYDEAVKAHNTADSAKYRNAANLLRNTLKYNHSRIPDGLPGAGGFFHKAQYPCQMWLDGLYMGPAMYAQWQNHFGADSSAVANNEAWTDIAHQFITLHKHTYDADKQLNYHGWSATPDDDNSFWARKDGEHVGCSPEFWGRGMGWYFAALVDILEWMPREHPDFAQLASNLQQVAAGLKRWQDEETGLWHQLLQYDSTMHADGKGDTINGEVYNVGTLPNYLESSASAIYTYSYFKAVRLGLIDKATYLPVALKAYQGMIDNFIFYDENGKIGIKNICASAGLGPAKDKSRTGTINYYLCGKDITITQNEGKAIGTFIMASVEYEMYAEQQ